MSVAPASRRAELVLARVTEALPEMVDALAELVRIPTVNPPGEHYEDAARAMGERCRRLGYETQYITAEGHPDHTARYPRVNVVARLAGASPGPCLHYNGHLDVVPPGDGWTVDPFAATVRDGKMYGRGTCDMKAGIIASIYAVEAIRRAGVVLHGAVEQSGTIDEESGGFAGVRYLAERGILARGKQTHVVITEPLDPDRVCLGHRGVYWLDVTILGKTAHGSMPFLGDSAIDRMARFLTLLDTKLRPALGQRRTALPVVPEGARYATINVNALVGGQPLDAAQSPCVVDRCTAVLDRRFLPEETLSDVRAELEALLREAGARYELRERMIVHPTATVSDAPIVLALSSAVSEVYARPAALVASPGTYDQKHFTRSGGLDDVVAYGPGRLDLAHKPDEWVALDDLERAAQVMALATMRLLGASG